VSFERALAIADTVLLEGYALYPYRASSRKNQFRWPFGVLAPKAWSDAGGCERWWMETQCLLRVGGPAKLDVRLRFMQVRRRVIEQAALGDLRPVETLDVDGRLFVTWDEGVLREFDFAYPSLDAHAIAETILPFYAPGQEAEEEIHDASGALAGRIVRRCLPLRGQVRISVEPALCKDLVRLLIRVENLTPWGNASSPRDHVLGASCAATHLLLSVGGASFVSLLDPPEWARDAASECRNVGTYPVLAGPPGAEDLVLSAPIILYDHPQVAPESSGDFFDATEIDELLTLRTSTLTEAEKREARATDARASEIVDRIGVLSPELVERLHGAIRDVERAEMRPRAPALGAGAFSLGPGSRVRLRPGSRRTDAQDMLFVGCVATVEKVMTDVDGQTCLAVTIDDDPAAPLYRWHGRYHYYYPDEVEALP
jgi:hypothetical protein